MSSLVPSPESPEGLVVVRAGELMTLPEYQLEPEAPIYLASGISVSEYGVRGFVLVDTKPENRLQGWYLGKRYGSGETTIGEDAPRDGEGSSDPLYIARHYGTRHGFKAVRYFVLPEAVTEFIDQDEWLGEPLLEKCLEEGTTPEDFHEQPIFPGDITFSEGHDRELINRKIAALSKIIPLVDPTSPESGFHDSSGEWDEHFKVRNQRAYVSFHPWQIYQDVTETLSRSVDTALSSVDRLLSRFDSGAGKIAAARDWMSDGNVLRNLTTHALQNEVPTSTPELET